MLNVEIFDRVPLFTFLDDEERGVLPQQVSIRVFKSELDFRVNLKAE